MTDTQIKDPRINLRLRIPTETPEGEVANYLLKNPLWSETKGRTMLLEGAMLLWLPSALSDRPEEAKQAALHSVRAMQRHILGLINEFGLNATELQLPLATPPLPLLSTTAIATPITPVATTMRGSAEPMSSLMENAHLFAGLDLDIPEADDF